MALRERAARGAPGVQEEEQYYRAALRRQQGRQWHFVGHIFNNTAAAAAAAGAPHRREHAAAMAPLVMVRLAVGAMVLAAAVRFPYSATEVLAVLLALQV